MNIYELIVNTIEFKIEHFSQSLKDFTNKNTKIILFAFFLGVMSFGYELFNFTLSVDEEIKTFVNTDLSWVSEGRWSNYILMKLFMPESLVPFLPTFIAVFFIVVSCLMFFAIIDADCFSKAIFCCLFITFPSNAYFMEFNTYNFAVSIGIASAVLSIILLKNFIMKKGMCNLFLSVLCAAFSIGVYQSIIGLLMCIISVYLLSLVNTVKDEIRNHYILKFCAFSLLMLGMSVLLYKLIDFAMKYLLGVRTDAYLNNFVGWKDNNILHTSKALYKNIVDHLLGQQFYGEKTILALWFVLAVLIVKIYLIKGKLTKLYGVAFIILALLSPFFVSICLGSPLPVRSMVGLPTMIAGIWYITSISLHKNFRLVLLGAALLIAISNSFSITRLFYTDYFNWQADRDLAIRIMGRVSTLDINYDNKPIPIVFIGEIKYRENPVFLKTESFGSSFFQYGGPNQYRISYFLRTLGINEFAPTSQVQIKQAIDISKSMKVWPNKDSVIFSANMIIIKLGEATEHQLAGSGA